MDQLWQALDSAFGFHLKPESLSVAQVALRTLAAYFLGWGLLRLAKKRILSRDTAFDVVLGFVLGSTLSRGINGSAPPLTTYAACILMVALHQFLTWISYRSHGASQLLNGQPEILIRNGRVLPEQLRRSHISPSDLDEELRLRAHTIEPHRIEEARIERNGNISILPRSPGAKILEVQVQEGVQTIRIELAS